MNIEELQEKIQEARKASQERNFTQTFDLIFNLQQIDLKKPDHKVDVGVPLYSQIKPKKLKICAVVDHTVTEAQKVFDKVLFNDELMALKGDMKAIREIIHKYDKFVVQANFMPQFAQVLGRYLGPMNKMPSPKLGMIITPKTPFKELYDKLQKTAHLQIRKNSVIQCPVGSEKESDETIAKNIQAIYDNLVHALPNHEHNIKEANLKLTMGKVVVL